MSDSPLSLDRYPQIVFKGVTAASVTPLSPVDDRPVTVAAVTPNKCMMCGQDIGPSARTCSANCRKAMSRRKEAIQREVNAAKDALRTLERYSDQWPDLYWQIMQAIGQVGIEASAASRRVAPKGDAI